MEKCNKWAGAEFARVSVLKACAKCGGHPSSNILAFVASRSKVSSVHRSNKSLSDVWGREI